MLYEVAAEVLLFLTRRDLDRVCAISKWLDALIAQSCNVFPLRPVRAVSLFPRWNRFMLLVSNKTDGRRSKTHHSFSSMYEAVHLAGSILRHSFVERFALDDRYEEGMPLCPSHWTTLFSAIRSGAVRRMSFYGVNFSALNDDAFLAAIGCRGLQSLTIESSYVPSGCFTDDLVRSSYAKRLLQLQFSENNKSHRLSDDAVLDFYLPTDASPGGQSRCFILEGSGVTDLFLAKCFERLRSSPSRPSGSLKFYGMTKQRGLSPYDQYLTPVGPLRMHATYRFPPMGGNSEPYEVELYECSLYTYVRFCLH
ncbi:hypothetical protein AAVH_22229 [Aphelenchoides avenae]|nr:hypothetical protein AAVH_22229 [Aphelenchus avenae]